MVGYEFVFEELAETSEIREHVDVEETCTFRVHRPSGSEIDRNDEVQEVV